MHAPEEKYEIRCCFCNAKIEFYLFGVIYDLERSQIISEIIVWNYLF